MRRIRFGLILVAAMALVGGGACPGPFGNSNPTVTLTVDQTSIAENGGVAIVTATLDQEIFDPVTVRLAYSGTAESGRDYTRSSMTITIPPLKTTGTVQLRGVTDQSFDGDRTVIVTIDSVTNGRAGNPGEVTVTVTDEPGSTPPIVHLTLLDSTGSDAQVSEGSLSEIGNASVLARLSVPAHDDITVDLTVTGTAVLDTNYTLSSTKIVIPAGVTVGALTVTGKTVAGFNGGLSIIFTIASATGSTGVTIDDANKEVTLFITDSEAPPTLTLAVAPETPIAENGGVATVTATLSKVILVPVTVPFTLSGSAKKDTNFTISSTQIVIPVGQTTGTLTVTGKDDGVYTGEQTLELQAGDVLDVQPSGSGQLTVTFQESTAPPSVSLDPKTFTLSENGGTATLTASLSAACGVDTTVSLSFGGTAVNGTDYTVSALPITIPAGQTIGTVTLTGKNDSIYEGAETIEVTVVSASNGVTISGGLQKASGAITDDETLPKVTLSLSGSPFAEAGGTAIVTASLSPLTTKEVTVDLGFTGTATKDTDYTASDTKIVIPAGQASGIIALTGISVPGDQGSRTIIVDITTVTPVTNAIEDGTQQVTATVTDIPPVVTLSTAGSPVTDQAGAAATVTVTLSKTIVTDLTIVFTLSGSATRDTDYTASGAQIVIPAGQTTGNAITLTLIGNNKYNLARTIVLTGPPLSDALYVGSNQVTVTLSATTALQYKAKGDAWLAQNATQPGVVVLPSGLQYKILTAGSGAIPKLTDSVTTAYTGTLIDGTGFDSSTNATFAVNGVIPGWTEALQLMPVGSKWMLYIPSNLGYGAAGSGSNIPPNAALIFQIELISIK